MLGNWSEIWVLLLPSSVRGGPARNVGCRMRSAVLEKSEQNEWSLINYQLIISNGINHSWGHGVWVKRTNNELGQMDQYMII